MSSDRTQGGNEMKNERVSVRISSEVKEWYEKMSKRTGISRSSLMAMAMYEWKDMKEGLEAMGSLGQMYREMSEDNFKKDEFRRMVDENNFFPDDSN